MGATLYSKLARTSATADIYKRDAVSGVCAVFVMILKFRIAYLSVRSQEESTAKRRRTRRHS